MLRTRTISYLLALAVGASSALTVPAFLGDSVAEAGQAKKKKKKKKKPAATKSLGSHAKAKGELMGPFKFGMSKEQVVAALGKQLDARYEEQIKETEDIHKQDQLRKDKATELNRVKKSYVAFEGQKAGWDASIISDEFRHKVGESMLEYWENQGGKNQRRFFFFDDGRLYKMFIQIDTTQFAENQQSYSYFSGIAKSKFGTEAVDPKSTYAKYNSGVFVHAVDKTRAYDAFCLVILDPALAREVDRDRKERIPVVKEDHKILNAVVESGDTSGPALDQNKDAVKGVIDTGNSSPSTTPKKK